MKIINYIIIGVLEIILCSNSNKLFCQKIKIFYESDSNSYNYLCSTEWAENKNYRTFLPIEFCPKLSDGKYVCRGEVRYGDTSNSYVMMTGTFKDSLREGPFIYYSEPEGDSGKIHPDIIYNYSKGLLNGYYFSYFGNNIDDEGYYVMGQRHGFFISFDYKGNLKSVQLYKHDTLTSWVEYSPQHTIYSSGYGCDSLMSGEYRQYYRNGDLLVQAYMEKGKIKRYTEYFHSGEIKSEGKGLFEQSQSIYPFYFINGVLKKYNENGVLIDTERK